ncbi:class I adenylate-forming enzyme family protein [Nocardia flavorosea]|uniref:Long-chain fatty acid--CoA ligase n=1 Tax=Nocardia flavorosea TaxID=53429 RepID=A0A846YL66_9NOCA|nr:AMP-binding protein [Nocardia flavorosea]NKY58334.1 long-chain fatty acid--CoA ligase [Nocardia flavorosea]
MRPIDFFDRGVRLFGNAVCMRAADVVLSYAEMAELTHRIAGALQNRGIGPGAAVAVLSPNEPLAFAAVLGTMRSGAAWVPVNARGTVSEHAHLIQLTGCTMIIAHYSLAEHARKVADCVDGIAVVQFGGPDPSLPDRWLAPRDTLVAPLPEDPAATVALPGTGGTTGRPKGVVLTERNFETIVTTFNACLPYPADHRPVNLVAAPMTHGAGMMTFPLLPLGAEVVVSAPDAVSILENIERYRVTQLFVPPTLLYMLIDEQRQRRADVSSLRYLVYGGAPASVERLREAVSVFGPVVTQLYGLTEAPIVCAHLTPEDHALAFDSPQYEHRLFSAGRPTIATSVEIMDEAGKLLPAHTSGEIVIKGSVVMAGYHNNATATEEAMRFGWYHTNDIGYRDEEGFVYIIDRKRDMIISGGFNVFPSEVEQVIHAHPGVADCTVIGVPDPKWGEAVTAIIETKPGAAISPEEIQERCRRELGSVKTPKTVEFWTELPRSPVGKILKRDIRQQFQHGKQHREI